MFCTINSQLSTSHQLSTSKAKYKRNTNFRNTVSTKALIRPSFLRTNSRSITRTNRIWDQTRQQTPENAWGQACRSDNCPWTPQKPKKKKNIKKTKRTQTELPGNDTGRRRAARLIAADLLATSHTTSKSPPLLVHFASLLSSSAPSN